MPNDQDEAFALRLVARGGGTFPLPEHNRFDEAIVAFHLEHPDYVTVYLRRDDLTKKEFCFRMIPMDSNEESVDEAVDDPRDIANALAERFLCDTLVVLKAMPRVIRRGALERALVRLKAGGQLEPGDSEVLEKFVGPWGEAATR